MFKSKGKGGFADNVRALGDLLTIGGKLATVCAVAGFVYVVQDGLADAFTRDFIRFAMIGGAFMIYKVVDRMAVAAEESAIAMAEKATAEAEKAKIEKVAEADRAMDMQALLIAAMSQNARPAIGGVTDKAGAPRQLRRSDVKAEIQRPKKAKRSAFVIK